MDVLDRFTSKIEVDTDTGCHNWNAGVTNSGYGRFKGKVDGLAHRWIYEKTVSEIPQGLEVDHTCNNRLCQNVEHMRLVTHKENMLAQHSNTHARINQEKTSCPAGHPLSGDNLYIQPKNGWRKCKECQQQRDALRRKVVT